MLLVMPSPLAMNSPGSRDVVELLELLELLDVLLMLDEEAVVLALLLAGVLGTVLVLPLMTSAVPFGSREYVVPDTTTESPGFRVVP